MAVLLEDRKRSQPTRRVKKTTMGRVVYNRKPHLFTIKDVKRILKNILLTQQNKSLAVSDEFRQDFKETFLLQLELLYEERGIVFIRPAWSLVVDTFFTVTDPYAWFVDRIQKE